MILGNFLPAIYYAVEIINITFNLSCVTLTMILYELLVKQAQVEYSTGYNGSIDTFTQSLVYSQE